MGQSTVVDGGHMGLLPRWMYGDCSSILTIAVLSVSLLLDVATVAATDRSSNGLQFRSDGTFKILQIADMHYENGRTTTCSDVPESWKSTCSDLNTTAFVEKLIAAEDPDLIVFSGDNIMSGSHDAISSMNAAFAPAIESGKPWAAVLGNHDQEADLDRLGLISYISQLPSSLTKLNPGCHVAHNCSPPQGTFLIHGRIVSRDFWACVSDVDDKDSPIAFRCGARSRDVAGTQDGVSRQRLPVVEGWGNYHLVIKGPPGSKAAEKTTVALYLLDSGDSSKLRPHVNGYDWIRSGQQLWLKSLASQFLDGKLDVEGDVPIGLAYFHIPLPEFFTAWNSINKTGVRQENECPASVNSGFFTTMLEARHIKAGFSGHDHVNDYCGSVNGIKLCYAGGVGYRAYGKVGWPRRARVVQLRTAGTGDRGDGQVKEIWTWKRLDDGLGDEGMSRIDKELLWKAGASDDGELAWEEHATRGHPT